MLSPSPSWPGFIIPSPSREARLAFQSAWALLTWPSHYVTSRGAFDRTRIASGHWLDVLATADTLRPLSLEAQDELVLSIASARSRRYPAITINI